MRAYKDQGRIGNTQGRRGRYSRTGIAVYQRPQVVMTGTCITAVLESEVVTGSETIILTLANGVWNKNTTAFEAARQAMINGMDSAQSENAGWDAEVKANESVTAVVRTSATVVTITLSAAGSFVITANETITVTIPAALLEGQIEGLAAGTFTVTNEA